MPDGSFSSEEKVRILLAEYTTVRGDILANSGYFLQVCGFAVAALSLLAIQQITWRSITVSVLLVVFVVCAIFQIAYLIWRAASRMRWIEQEVNKRAGEKLLEWETVWGFAERWLPRRDIER